MKYHSLFQFAPQGSFYNTKEEQIKSFNENLNEFFNYDRMIFMMCSMLETTSYFKGRAIAKILQNPYVNSDVKKNNEVVEYGLHDDYEIEMILYILRKDGMAKALKNLLMLKNIDRINNSRTKKIILRYIFERDAQSLQSMAITYKHKIQRLLEHALGNNIRHKIIKSNKIINLDFLNKYNPLAYDIFMFVNKRKFNDENVPMIAKYIKLKELAKSNSSDAFMALAGDKKIPYEVLMGFRNFFKLNIDLKSIYEQGRMSEKQEINSVRVKQRVGAERGIKEINYKNKDIYDLYKLLYTAVLDGDIDKETMEQIEEGIIYQAEQKIDLGICDVTILFDCSGSMMGSDIRKLHPFLTGLSLVSKLDHVKKVIMVGGTPYETGLEKINNIVVPSGETKLYEEFINAVGDGNKTILIISDGYENSIEGLCNIVYKELRNQGKIFNVLHVNPVYASEVSGLKKLFFDVEPMAMDNYKYLHTNILFEMIMQDKKVAKKMLATQCKKLLTMG